MIGLRRHGALAIAHHPRREFGDMRIQRDLGRRRRVPVVGDPAVLHAEDVDTLAIHGDHLAVDRGHVRNLDLLARLQRRAVVADPARQRLFIPDAFALAAGAEVTVVAVVAADVFFERLARLALDHVHVVPREHDLLGGGFLRRLAIRRERTDVVAADGGRIAQLGKARAADRGYCEATEQGKRMFVCVHWIPPSRDR